MGLLDGLVVNGMAELVVIALPDSSKIIIGLLSVVPLLSHVRVLASGRIIGLGLIAAFLFCLNSSIIRLHRMGTWSKEVAFVCRYSQSLNVLAAAGLASIVSIRVASSWSMSSSIPFLRKVGGASPQ